MNTPGTYWRSVPTRSRIIGLLGVFFLFSTVGFSVDMMQLGYQPKWQLALAVALYGGFAMLYAIIGTVLRQHWWKGIIPLIFVQMVVMSLFFSLHPVPSPPSSMDAAAIVRLQRRLSFSGNANIWAMVLGYACFLYVSITEGRRYFRAHAEIELASEIHRTLVPVIDTTISGFEFYGRSIPSGEVGGDLIDVFHDDRGWMAYIADVSGHGVAPGVVMAMVKSAARMRLSCEGSAGLLESLNSVLCSVTRPEMFVTFAYLASSGDRLHCAYSLAGHPAILHYHAATGEFSEVTCSNLPLGMFDRQSYATSMVESAPGDLFLLLTDGLLEIEDAKGEEFGLDGVKAIVLKNVSAPAATIFQSLLDAAKKHGPAADDQSLLIVRSNAGQPAA